MSDFVVTVHDPDRAAEWRQVFGTESLPVRSAMTEMARLPGFDLPQRIYLLDWAALPVDRQLTAIAHLVAKWGLPAEEVEADIERDGFPLLADGCSVTVAHPARWLD